MLFCAPRTDRTEEVVPVHKADLGSPFNRSKSAADTTEPAGQAGSRPRHADSRDRALTCAAPVKWRPLTAVTHAPHVGPAATFRDGSRSAASAGRSRHGEHPDAQGE